jgi:hypothetical protein
MMLPTKSQVKIQKNKKKHTYQKHTNYAGELSYDGGTSFYDGGTSFYDGGDSFYDSGDSFYDGGTSFYDDADWY